MDEHPDFSNGRVCIFKDLLIWKNTVYYIKASPNSIDPPPILIAWEGLEELQLEYIESLPIGSSSVALTVVPEAALLHQQHPSNFYHLFMEIAPTAHYIVCKYLRRCDYASATEDFRIFWINKKSPLVTTSMTYRLPSAIKELFKCFSPNEVDNIYDATLSGQAYLLRSAIVGLSTYARFYHQKKDEWRKRLHDPPPFEYMQSYRTRIAHCMGYDFVNARAPTNPPKITLVQRPYEAGRSILNLYSIKKDIQKLGLVKQSGAQVDIVYLEGSLREQAEHVWNSSVYIWAHGAAMAQTFFLPRGARAIEIVQWAVDDPSDQHIWVEGIKEAFQLDITLDVVVNDDPSKVFFKLDTIWEEGSQYHTFNDTEKVQLIEKLKCPETPYADGLKCFGWFHWGMSLVLKWDLLKAKLIKALDSLINN